MGDFNSVFDYDQCINGCPILEAEIADVRACIQQLGLEPLKSLGQFFSWCKGSVGEGRILSRIDYAIGNSQWRSDYGSNYVNYLLPHISDNTPLCVRIGDTP